MDAEERFELDAIETEAESQASSALATGAAMLEHDEAVRAVRLGRKALSHANASDSTRGDQRAYQLIYPLLRRDEVVGLAHANRLDPAFVAAVIRQESGWYPRAVSVAGARGLMQVLPSVGEQIARSRRYPVWDAALLFDPDVNLELGTAHLRASIDEQRGSTARALAAYNAGASRVRRWSQRAGSSDPELFIERIPFDETREYVRIVLRNAEIYRALYKLQ
jgi:soluble lytic murein transglycosylase